MRGIGGIHPGWGITGVRLVMAAIFIVAGYKKWAAGFGAVSANFAKIGIPAPDLMGPYIVILELVGGVLLLLGIAARWLGLLFALEFVVASFYYKLPALGWDAGRIDLMLLAGGILLFLAGGGKAAVDQLWLEKGS